MSMKIFTRFCAENTDWNGVDEKKNPTRKITHGTEKREMCGRFILNFGYIIFPGYAKKSPMRDTTRKVKQMHQKANHQSNISEYNHK